MLAALIHLGLCIATAGCGGGGDSASEARVAAVAASAPVSSILTAPATATDVALATAATPAAPAARSASLTFTFDLPAERSTSAGVYDADDHLMRTLWSGRRLPAGQHSATWDRRDDAGNLLPVGRYTVRVIHHDVQYVWEGAVGNSSANPGVALPHRSYHGPSALAYAGGRMHYGVGFNEGGPMVVGFDIADPQRPLLDLQSVDAFAGAQFIATDGTRLYWANTGGFNTANFVAAYDLASGARAAFPEGTPFCMVTRDDGSCYPGAQYSGVLALHADAGNPPTGIAVQAAGPVLAVAYAAENRVRLFDKTSGHALGELAVTLATGSGNHLAMAPDGDLWVLTPGGAQRWTALATTPQLAAQVTGLARPLAVAVDPQDRQSVWVADGGRSQQVKHFDADGRALGALGRAGGCTATTAIGADTLCFLLTPSFEQTGLAVDGSHALWVVDTSNNRIVQFGADGAPVATVSYLPATYAVAVDTGNPARVFANFLEFRVDPALTPGQPGGWTLVRNWLPTLPSALRDANAQNREWGGFFAVRTLANGRTYALLKANNQQALVELGADGRLRRSSALRTPQAGESVPVIEADGSLTYARTEGGQQRVLSQRLDRFNVLGDPVWSTTVTTRATVPADAASPAYPIGTFTGLSGAQFPATASGRVVFLNPAVDAASGYHLGAADGSGGWAWRASPSGSTDGRGSFQTRAQDSQIQYGGNLVQSDGHNIVYGYHGEFWTDPLTRKTGQANQFMHYTDSGLFVGQFGVPSTRLVKNYGPGVGGNSFAIQLVRTGGATYLYHNDEWGSGGVVRWRLQGADDLRELSGTVTPASGGATLTLR